MSQELICISCPVGCHLVVEQNGEDIAVTGNRCLRGEKYAINELTAPKRMISCVVQCDSESVPCLPVRSASAIDKAKIDTLLAELRRLKVATPVKMGEVVLANFADSGVDIIACRTIEN